MTELGQAVRTGWHMPKETEATPAVFASSIVWGRARWVDKGLWSRASVILPLPSLLRPLSRTPHPSLALCVFALRSPPVLSTEQLKWELLLGVGGGWVHTQKQSCNPPKKQYFSPAGVQSR